VLPIDVAAPVVKSTEYSVSAEKLGPKVKYRLPDPVEIAKVS
jgi:hypothetical protein